MGDMMSTLVWIAGTAGIGTLLVMVFAAWARAEFGRALTMLLFACGTSTALYAGPDLVAAVAGESVRSTGRKASEPFPTHAEA